ncbi:hypothetical protein TRVA0_001S04148 [Trichomonascus vanleenenianus]|uniref:uncharacterized protein n=1 Tax=Trichomonascus vanleenenianus TaxID=2268995 RepID=UPI003ECB80CB
MANIGTLIDLSTPKPAKTYSQDFTPTLSRALAECFSKRRQSMRHKRRQSSNNNHLSMISEDQENIEPLTMAKGLESEMPALVSLKSNKIAKMHQSIIESPKLSRKRTSGAPLTPSVLKTVKRRALSHKPTNQYSPIKGENEVMKNSVLHRASRRISIVPEPTQNCEERTEEYHDVSYEKWIAEKRVVELEGMVEFLELEKKFGL